jgi:thymidylate kinase
MTLSIPPSCKRLTIFEGCDGSGKSTAARRFAELTGAVYVHFPALPLVTEGLARLYVEAMLPALLGYQDVVFDRCWLSEVPYGLAYRGGQDRLGDASRRMLERLALRCGAVVVHCHPPAAACLATFRGRRGEEYLESEAQLLSVYGHYTDLTTALPRYMYDYTQDFDLFGALSPEVVDSIRTPRHPLAYRTAGNLQARLMLVGLDFAERKDQDPWYQWPFASFSHSGCSQWLARQLGDVTERQLLWVNSDDPFIGSELFTQLVAGETFVIALGNEATERLRPLVPGRQLLKVPHPQHAKRFNSGRAYPLTAILKGLTHVNE